jgi:UDP:flavonoid glycosyltransferase YjiC (YdhE family)
MTSNPIVVPHPSRAKRSRILISPEGTEGDIRPLLALGMGLQAAGHAVTACVPPDFAAYFTSRNIPARPMGMPVKDFIQLNAAAMSGRTLAALKPMIETFARVVNDQFRSLEEHGREVDLIIAGGLQFAAGSIAEKNRIPFVHAVHVPVVASSATYPPMITHNLALWPVVNRCLWSIYNVAMNLLLLGTINRQRKGIGLPAVSSIERFYAGSMLLAQDTELVTVPADAVAFGFPQTGYWQLQDDREIDPAVQRFIADGPAPVFIGFGSMGDPCPHKTIVIIREALRLAGVRALLAPGWAEFAPGLLTDSTILLVGHVPHLKIFGSMAAVVHHGGAGTVNSAARSGVPQVIVPHMLDQYFWGHRVHCLGLGPRAVRRAILNPQRLGGAIRAAIDNKDYARNAQALGTKIAARDGVAEAVALCEKLLG